MKLNPLAAADALLKAANLAATGYEDLVLTGVAASIVVEAAPMDVAKIKEQREALKAAYAADPQGVAARLLPGLSSVFDAIKGLV